MLLLLLLPVCLQAADLAEAGQVYTMARTPATFSWQKNLLTVKFEGVGVGAITATILPTAIPFGKVGAQKRARARVLGPGLGLCPGMPVRQACLNLQAPAERPAACPADSYS